MRARRRPPCASRPPGCPPRARAVALALLLGAAALTAGFAADTAVDAPGNFNPLMPGYFADPTIERFDDTFYLYATTDGNGGGRGPATVWVSRDFANWVLVPMNWPTTPHYWAPDVVRRPDGRYYLYYNQPCITYGAASDSPLGPWTPLTPGEGVVIPDRLVKDVITLDTQVFEDTDGTLYGYWGTWGIFPNSGCGFGVFQPEYAVDDNNATLWRPANNRMGHWLTVDLGSPRRVRRTHVQFEYATWYYQYVLETSLDGRTWGTFADRRHNTRWGSPMVDDGNVEARFVRLTVTGTEFPGLFGAVWNFKIFCAAPADPLLAMADRAFQDWVAPKQAGRTATLLGGPDRTRSDAPGEHDPELRAPSSELRLQGRGTLEQEPAPNLLVHLDVADLPLGASRVTWTNRGTLGGEFAGADARPIVALAMGRKAVRFSGHQLLTAPFPAPRSLAGNSSFTVAAWVNNPEIGQSECLVSWAGRGGPDATTAQVGYGTHREFGAVGHWGFADMGFKSAPPEAGQWHHLAVVFDGVIERVYVDGRLDNAEAKMLLLHAGRPIYVGASEPGTEFFDGYLASYQRRWRRLAGNARIAGRTAGHGEPARAGRPVSRQLRWGEQSRGLRRFPDHHSQTRRPMTRLSMKTPNSSPTLLIASVGAVLLIATAAHADALWLANPQLKAPNKAPQQAQAFPLKEVRLLDGPFHHPQELWVTYWGSDGGNRVFDIFADDRKLATRRLENNKPDRFFDEIYPLPQARLRSKQTITVKFQAHPDTWAGGLFGARVMKAKKVEATSHSKIPRSSPESQTERRP